MKTLMPGGGVCVLMLNGVLFVTAVSGPITLSLAFFALTEVSLFSSFALSDRNCCSVQASVETWWPSSPAGSPHTCTSTAPLEKSQMRPRAATTPAAPSADLVGPHQNAKHLMAL